MSLLQKRMKDNAVYSPYRPYSEGNPKVIPPIFRSLPISKFPWRAQKYPIMSRKFRSRVQPNHKRLSTHFNFIVHKNIPATPVITFSAGELGYIFKDA